ncbi:MAG: YezD family protein [Candidatus Omnitrophica bacterium]|nr:YezD family protein [Candidatus Omnitrophota bacterium]
MSCKRKIIQVEKLNGNIETRAIDLVLNDIAQAVKEIRYGSVQIHIQDGKVIQIDKVNKVRLS